MGASLDHNRHIASCLGVDPCTNHRSSEFNKLGRIHVLKARMNADLHMAGDLKNTGKGNLFVIFGEPDIEVMPAAAGQIQVKIKGRRRFSSQHGRGAQRRRRGHRLLVHRQRLQPGEFFCAAGLFSGRQRSLQIAQNDAQGRDRRRRLGHAPQRHLAALRQAAKRANCRERRRGVGLV
jgi:hypothetical protein